MRGLRGHLRANLVAYVALFFALGLGSAWAATELSRNAVTSKHVKNRGAKTKDLRECRAAPASAAPAARPGS